jgi:large subunit ribosomal protein L19
MKNKYIASFEQAQIAGKNIPEFRAGDTLRLAVTITEGEKSRVQNYEGICKRFRGNLWNRE